MSSQVPHIFDSRRREAVTARARHRQARGGAARWLADAMSEDAAERLGFMRFAGTRVLLSGAGSDSVARALGLPAETIAAKAPDFERPLEGGSYDAIVALAALDSVNDLPGALIHLRHALAPGGVLLAALIGGGSLPMLRAAMLAADGDRPAARIHPQVDSRAASALLQRAGFARQVVDQWPLTVRYPSLDRLVADLRDQGLGSVLADRAPPLGRAALERARAAFSALAENDGKTSERFEILTLTAWKD